MPEYLTPAVYVEETSFRSRSIEGVATSTAGIAGFTRYGPVPHELSYTPPPGSPPPPPAVKEPPLVTTYGEFERAFGGLSDVAGGPNYTALAARAFFDNGGRRLYVARVFNWPRDASGNIDFSGLFASRLVSSNGTDLAEWRARWPGEAGEQFEVIVKLRRSKNVLVPATDATGAQTVRLSTVREYALVELAPLQDVTTRADDVQLNPASVRVVRRNPVSGDLELEGPAGREPLPTDQAAFHLRLEVLVRWGDREDSHSELAVHPQHPRSIFTVLSREDPADEYGLVWLRWAGPADPTPQELVQTLQQLVPALLTPGANLTPRRGVLLEGGADGLETTPETIQGDEANPDDQRQRPSGLNALGEIDDIAIVLAPDTARLADVDSSRAAVDRLISHCERLRYRMAIVDPPRESSISEVRRFRSQFDTKYAALYYPWLEILDPNAVPDPGAPPPRLMLPPSGFVAGIYARNDIERGVFKAPANEVIRGITRFETNVTYDRQSVLNPEGINALRFFEGRSNRVWGARTMSSDPEWRYVNVRRLFIYLEHSIDRSTQWAVFEPNNENLWASIRQTIEDFLFVTWRSGALMGTRPEEAYFVRCDRTTMTQNDLDNGRLICLIGVAPTYPAEFVIFRIGQWTADARRT
jgi:phage tail sheath protein FI